MSATKNINAEKIQGNLNINGITGTSINVNGQYTLPNTLGNNGEVLTIDNSGNLGWSAVTINVTNVSIGTNDQIPFMNSVPNDFDYSSDLTFDDTKLRVTNGTGHVDIFDSGYIDLYRSARTMRIIPGGTNYILSSGSNSNMSFYTNTYTGQLHLMYNNPYVGINQTAPSANLHVKGTVNGQTPFIVENSTGTRGLEVTSDGKVKISDAYTLPNTVPSYGNVIIADGAGGTTWGEFPLDTRWESSGVFNGDFSTSRVTSKQFRVVELNSDNSSNNFVDGHSTWTEPGLILGGGNTFGDVEENAASLMYHQLVIGSGNTIGEYRVNQDVTIGSNNKLSVLTKNWPASISGATFNRGTYGYVIGTTSYTTGDPVHDTSRTFVLGDDNYVSGTYNFVSGVSNRIFGYDVTALGSGISGYTHIGNDIYNLRSTHVLGDNIHAGHSNQILIGRGFSTLNTNTRQGIYFGWSSSGTTNASIGFIEPSDLNLNSTATPNFAMGGYNVFTSGSTTGVYHEGAGSGNMFLYNDEGTVEPSGPIPSAVALYGKRSPRNVVGLAIRSEDETVNLISDTVSIGFSGGTAMLEVKSKGNNDVSGDLMNVRNSNGDSGMRITNGLKVYLENLPISPGGLTSGGVWHDTSTDTLKIVP